jgi:hypothetical protein
MQFSETDFKLNILVCLENESRDLGITEGLFHLQLPGLSKLHLAPV